MKIILPHQVAELMQVLQKQGYEANIVGGCVRDAILGVEPNDWDIATSATPQQVIHSLAGYRVIETGLQHGTVTAVVAGQCYEITSYRTEGEYHDHRRPSQVSFDASLEMDLSRRDFTINAMAYNSVDGLTDLFGGRQDIAAERIRCVGDPQQRFREDALRIMRALRFASCLEFRIDPGTAQAIQQQKELLHHIAQERICSELCRMLCGPGVLDTLQAHSDVLFLLLPELAAMENFAQNNPHHYLDTWQHTVHSVAAIPSDPFLRLAMLFHDSGKPHCYTEEDGCGHFYGHSKISSQLWQQAAKRLRFDNETIWEVDQLILQHDTVITPCHKQIKRRLSKLGEPRLRRLLAVKRADILAQAPSYREERLVQLDIAAQILEEILEQQQCFSLRDLAVSGSDLMASGIPQGPQVGKLLAELLEMVMDEQVENSAEALLALAKQLGAVSAPPSSAEQ